MSAAPRPVLGRPGTELLLVSGLSLALVAVVGFTTDLMTYAHFTFPKRWDHHAYIAMAQRAPLDYHFAPYCWRIATPLVAKALPFDLLFNFLLICFASLWLTGVALYYIGRMLGYSAWTALVGVLLYYSLPWATKFVLFDFWLPDAPAFLVITTAILCIVGRKDLAFTLALAVGVTVKESVLFVAPLHYTLRARGVIDLAAARRTLALVLPAVGVLVALRLGIPAANEYSYAERWGRIAVPRLQGFSPASAARIFVYAFGVPLSVFSAVGAVRRPALLLRLLPFFALVCAQLLFAKDTQRLVIAAFPGIVMLGLHGLADVSGWLRVRAPYLASLPLAVFLLNASDPFRRPPPLRTQLIVAGVPLALILCAALLRAAVPHGTLPWRGGGPRTRAGEGTRRTDRPPDEELVAREPGPAPDRGAT